MTDGADHSPRTVPAGTAVLMGEPAVEPIALLAAIAEATDRLPEVRSLSRCWAQSGDQPPGLIVAVDLDPDDRGARIRVVDAVTAAWRAVKPGFVVDVVFAADGGAVVRWMQQNVKPFHQA